MLPLPPTRLSLIVAAAAAASLASACVPSAGESTRHRPAADGGGATLLVEPDDGPAPVLAFLRGAQRSLAVEVYLLTDDDAIQALVDLRLDGREVQVILEPHPFGADGANQPAFDRLAAGGVAVTWASPRFALTHTKTMVADGRRALIGSLNLTRAGLRGNREYLIADQAAADVADAAAILAADRLGATASTPPPAASRLIASPVNARAGLLSLIGGARGSLAIEIEELSDPEAVTAIAGAVARGVAVSAVVPGSERSATTQAAVVGLVEAGVAVRALLSPTVHAKAIVADGTRVYIGSVNLTSASLDHNREIGLVLEDPTLAARVARTVAADWARAGEL